MGECQSSWQTNIDADPAAIELTYERAEGKESLQAEEERRTNERKSDFESGYYFSYVSWNYLNRNAVD